MTKDLPKVLDIPVLTGHGRMRDRLDALEKSWNGALASNCNQAGRGRVKSIRRCGACL